MKAEVADVRREEKAVSPVIATILMVAITVVLAGVLYVWANNLAAEGTDTTMSTMNVYTAQDASADTTSATDDTLLRLQMSGKDTLSWAFMKIQLSVGDTVYRCGMGAGDACTIGQQGGDNNNAWEPSEFIFLAESGTDICDDETCFVAISITYNGAAVAGNLQVIIGGAAGESSGGGSSGGGSSSGPTNVNFVVTSLDEINSGANAVIGEYGGRVLVGNTLYFDAHEGNAGRELWSHNTATGQNSLAADIRSGANSGSNPGYYGGITAVGTRLYFDADDNVDGTELWAYETTNSSAWLAADIRSGGSSNPGQYSGITAMGTRLYFDAYTDSSGRELWAHETTNGSTWQVADISSGSNNGYPGFNAGLTVVGTRLYFDATDVSNGFELWTHETANSSTWRVADIYSDSGDGVPGKYAGVTAMGTRLYFDAYTDSSGHELWAHETTDSSTWLVADIASCGGCSDWRANGYPGFYAGLTAMGTRLYFDAGESSTGTELWAHETTNSSTWLVADINSGSGNSLPGQYAGITVVGTRLYFDASGSDAELWAHETTNTSTWKVADINSGDANPGQYAGITVMGARIFFDADDGSNGRELWAHDTTNGSTWRVTDINTDGGSYPGRYTAPTVVGNRLYFEAYTPDTSYEMWMMEIVTS
jgi:flagellin-like protein